MTVTSDYSVPCSKSQVSVDGVCRKKLHRNIGGGLHRLIERMAQEEKEAELQSQKTAFDEQRKQIDMQEKMLGVGLGTHRVIKNKAKP